MASALCVTHVFLDNDDAGRNAYEKAVEEGMLKMSNTTFVTCRGIPSSELEDCYDKAAYESEVLTEFGVDLNDTSFRGNQKWSDRAKKCFEKQGKPWTVKVKAELKHIVAATIAKKPELALGAHRRDSIDALVTAMERKLGSYEFPR